MRKKWQVKDENLKITIISETIGEKTYKTLPNPIVKTNNKADKEDKIYKSKGKGKKRCSTDKHKSINTNMHRIKKEYPNKETIERNAKELEEYYKKRCYRYKSKNYKHQSKKHKTKSIDNVSDSNESNSTNINNPIILAL